MKDTYGLSPAEQPRRIERFAEPEWEEQTDDAPLAPEQPTVEPGEVPDYSDTAKWIETRQPETAQTQVGSTETDDGINRPVFWTVATGRYLIGYRARTLADGNAPFVMLPAVYPKPPDPPKMQKHVWFDSAETGPRRSSLAEIQATRRRHEAEYNRSRGSRSTGADQFYGRD